VCAQLPARSYRLNHALLRDSIPRTDAHQKDTLKLKLVEAERLFIDRNLALLAQKYNIESSKAQVWQDRLWDNPNVWGELTAYNRTTGQYLPLQRGDSLEAGGEVQITVTQLIKTAGKRSRLVQLDKIGVEIAENVFYDLLRSLKFQLRSNYFLLWQYEKSAEAVQNELNAISFLIRGMREQVAKGNVAQKDLIRLQALQFDLQNMRKDFLSAAFQAESQLKVILRLPGAVVVHAVEDAEHLRSIGVPNLDSLTTVALENRYDLKIAADSVRYAKQFLKWQKSLAYPDVQAHFAYVRYSNYIPDYRGLGLAVDVPTFNRNQGNIAQAKWDLKVVETGFENSRVQAMNDVSSAYKQLLVMQQNIEEYDRPFQSTFDDFFKGLIQNYEKRNIGLIEFIDFFETYRDTKLQALNLEQDFLQAKEQLNFAVGKDIFK
jgi:cobalt-zinc-cadmium efflux system outer membrane protein